MNAQMHTTNGAKAHNGPSSLASHEAEMVNRWLLTAVAEAWRRYPAKVKLPYQKLGEARELAGKVVDRLAQDGLVQLSGDGLALSEAGYAAVDRVGRSDERFSELLQAGSLPRPSTASSLVLAVLRAHFELSHGTARR